MLKRSLVEERAAVLRLARTIVRRQPKLIADSEALDSAAAFEHWRAGESYPAETLLRHGGGLFRVVQPVSSLEHQPPGSEGMLAVYRPIVPSAAGTAEDPIAFVYGLDCVATLYYSYKDKIYVCNQDLPACIWPPDSGIHQWSEV